MKDAHVLHDIDEKNRENELQLCLKAGGDVEKLRRLSFNSFQLEQIRLGLEHGIDVETYMDPDMSWLEMENKRQTLELGIDLEKYRQMGYDDFQCSEIMNGIKSGVDILFYLNTDFMGVQMKEIRKGLEKKLDISVYARPEYDWMQMREIRKGLEANLDVSRYANEKYKYLVMRAIRKGMIHGVDLVDYAERDYSGRELLEVAKAASRGQDLITYLERGYNFEQLHQINEAFAQKVDVGPYLNKSFRGGQIAEVVKGLVKNLDVSSYAKKEYNWMQMRVIRHALNDRLDVSPMLNPEFSPRQMEEIHQGLAEGLDVTEYAKVYYEPEEMQRLRKEMEQYGGSLSKEMQEIIRNTIVEPEAILEVHMVSEEKSEDFLLDSCISVSDDKMEVTANFSVINDINPDYLATIKIPDVMRLLSHNDVKQGIKKDAIKKLIKEKKFMENVVIAEGKTCVNGDDGWYEYHFRKDVEKKPRVLPDGSVDYKSIELFEAVEKNALVAEYHSATQGVFGYDVEGKLIAPKRGKELPPLHGTGFIVSDDKKKYYSLMDGIIEVNEYSNELIIRQVYVVKGNVGLSTGNIEFDGDVNVLGNIEAGYSVYATGNIAVEGFCENCIVKAGKNIVMKKGFQGHGTGCVTAQGDISGKFFESATIAAGGDVEASYLLNCDVAVKGTLKVEGRRGVILGGNIKARQGVNCHSIGNIAEIRTIVEVGIDRDDMAAYHKLLKKIDKLNAELQTCEESLDKFMAIPERDEKTIAFCEKLTKAIYTQKLQKQSLLKEQEERMEIMAKQRNARITVQGNVFPGSLLYLNSEPILIKRAYYNVSFVKRDNVVETVQN
ncbi:MAG: FapA family protein [Eubacterium sp.]|nr:FapA family protein [Eubacterium sp.]